MDSKLYGGVNLECTSPQNFQRNYSYIYTVVNLVYFLMQTMCSYRTLVQTVKLMGFT